MVRLKGPMISISDVQKIPRLQLIVFGIQLLLTWWPSYEKTN